MDKFDILFLIFVLFGIVPFLLGLDAVSIIKGAPPPYDDFVEGSGLLGLGGVCFTVAWLISVEKRLRKRK